MVFLFLICNVAYSRRLMCNKNQGVCDRRGGWGWGKCFAYCKKEYISIYALRMGALNRGEGHFEGGCLIEEIE